MSDKVDFLHAFKPESFLQIGSVMLDGDGQEFPNFPKIASLQCLHNISKKELEMKLIFCKQINIKVSYKSISTLCTSKFAIIIDGHDQASSKYQSSQYFSNISKKKLATKLFNKNILKRW